MEDAVNHRTRLPDHFARAGDRTDLHAFAAARARIRHRVDARGESGFEGGAHVVTREQISCGGRLCASLIRGSLARHRDALNLDQFPFPQKALCAPWLMMRSSSAFLLMADN